MNRIIKKLTSLFLVLVLLGIASAVPTVVSSKAVATKVKTEEHNHSSGIAKYYVKGYTKNNKLVWTFSSSPQYHLGVTPFNCVVKNKRVYVFDGEKIIALSKATGKRIFTKKGVANNMTSAYVTSKYTCYAMAFYDGRIVKLNSKGKRMWVSERIGKYGYYWGVIKKIKNNKIYVEASIRKKNGFVVQGTVVFNAKNGKVIKHYLN